MNRYAGRTVLITGSGRGIGRATALRLAKEGAAVAVLDIDSEPAHEVARLIGAMGRTAVALVGDIADDDAGERQVAAAAEKALGPPDVLVNNAAWAGQRTLEATEPGRLGRRVRRRRCAPPTISAGPSCPAWRSAAGGPSSALLR
ncbi:MAG: SDR family NAD(P)-dependent oxidoreductase [Geminicoccaceae bacterium]